ncbi:hypothetical protein WK57_19915 [Burkholderia ubonensis]|uniref:Uncharacterized protein n=1 Tax=Burkholderia ubonensis TaxID=101571 RepID=A0AA40R7I3_9BURK|nr:hypothetical protein WK57_19915 [Burkholderia ubonensis]
MFILPALFGSKLDSAQFVARIDTRWLRPESLVRRNDVIAMAPAVASLRSLDRAMPKMRRAKVGIEVIGRHENLEVQVPVALALPRIAQDILASYLLVTTRYRTARVFAKPCRHAVRYVHGRRLDTVVRHGIQIEQVHVQRVKGQHAVFACLGGVLEQHKSSVGVPVAADVEHRPLVRTIGHNIPIGDSSHRQRAVARRNEMQAGMPAAIERDRIETAAIGHLVEFVHQRIFRSRSSINRRQERRTDNHDLQYERE